MELQRPPFVNLFGSRITPKSFQERTPTNSKKLVPQKSFPGTIKWRGETPRVSPNMYFDFEGYPPEWFLAITCTIWLRLKYRGRGSAWIFSAHLLFFHAWGQIFEPRIGFWIPRSTFWPGDLFGVKNGSQKK